MKYPPNERDAVRRAYILKKPCQPRSHKFPRKNIGGSRRFMPYWGDALVNKGFKSWNKPDRFLKHIGGVKSAHNLAYEKYVNLRDGKKKSILVSLDNATEVTIREFDICLKASISCLRYLLRQGLGFRGHRENSESLNRGNFLKLLKWLRTHNEVVSKVTLENAPENCQLISPTIQKDIINCCAKETTKQIVDELGVDYFAILADESNDVSQKEQLSLCLRYVQRKTGLVVERFIGLDHVGDTTALSLRSAIISLFMEHSLSPSKIRGQGYDGASNMKGEIHGLKTLIMEDTPSAYYIHCFAHQLQLTLVAIAKKNDECAWLFDTVAMLLNVVGVSCKRRELIHEIQAQKLAQALEVDELETGFGLNQELGLKKPGDTRWSSHYKTLLNVMDLFSTIFKVLMIIGKDGSKSEDKCKAQDLEACYMPHGRSKRFVQQVTYRHHFRIDVFIEIIDLLLQEFDNRFDEVNMELIRCMACFNPRDGFSSFDKESVLKLATFYPSDLSSIDLRTLECQLDIFMEDMKRDNDFQNLQDISSLSMKLVETKRDVAYPLVFLIIKLILILPVATASVERVFSGMTFVKNKLRNRIGDQPLNDCLVTFIEKEMFLQVSDDDIVHRFEEMKTRRKIN
ncbi:zinc finger MYM-type protein 1-like [Salvia splendens]|uniref:zinc finger MYM-type protein 1-like n=1 Tax=Salvia splendens TaxID=180675 RepID=UPI001C27FD66|nr:zinc finger MYM-type protein 1-like [Salvia splendens]